MAISFREVTSNNWDDLVQLFESRGGPHACWCMVWRNMEKKGKEKVPKAAKKAGLKAYIDRQDPIGLLAYDEAEPIAWCSVGPRATYRKLSGDDRIADEQVWSLTCFFIKRPYRQQGLSEQLIAQAIETAKRHGATYLEAYPVAPDAPSYRFMGFVPTFEKLGFSFQHMAGSRRHVMWLKLT